MGVWPHNEQRTTMPSTWNCSYRSLFRRSFDTTSGVPLCHPRGTVVIVYAVVYMGVWPHNEQRTTMPSAWNCSHRWLCMRAFDPTVSRIPLSHPPGTVVIVYAAMYMGVWPNNEQRITMPSIWNCSYSICRYVYGRLTPQRATYHYAIHLEL